MTLISLWCLNVYLSWTLQNTFKRSNDTFLFGRLSC